MFSHVEWIGLCSLGRVRFRYLMGFQLNAPSYFSVSTCYLFWQLPYLPHGQASMMSLVFPKTRRISMTDRGWIFTVEEDSVDFPYELASFSPLTSCDLDLAWSPLTVNQEYWSTVPQGCDVKNVLVYVSLHSHVWHTVNMWIRIRISYNWRLERWLIS